MTWTVWLDSSGVVSRVERGPEFLNPRTADDPATVAQGLLVQRLQPHFQLTRAVSVAILTAAQD